MAGRIEVLRLSGKYQFVLFVEWQGDNKEIMVAEDPKGKVIFCKHQMGCWCEVESMETVSGRILPIKP